MMMCSNGFFEYSHKEVVGTLNFQNVVETYQNVFLNSKRMSELITWKLVYI